MKICELTYLPLSSDENDRLPLGSTSKFEDTIAISKGSQIRRRHLIILLVCEGTLFYQFFFKQLGQFKKKKSV